MSGCVSSMIGARISPWVASPPVAGQPPAAGVAALGSHALQESDVAVQPVHVAGQVPVPHPEQAPEQVPEVT
jgi:hypothetical protein